MATHALTTRRSGWRWPASVFVLHVHGQPGPACGDQARVQPLYTLLENKYYMDWFNENVLARGAARPGHRACGKAATRA
jgi:NADH-quinone oxidoreductase subunit L